MNLMKYRKWFYIISLLIIIPGTVSLFLWRLVPSIDFTGGTEVEVEGTKDTKAITDYANKEKFQNITVTTTSGGVIVRSKEISQDQQKNFTADINNISGAKVTQVQTVGPSVSKEITRRAFTSVLLASVLIIFYIGYSFRKVPKPANSWEFGFMAVFALLHDILVVVGIFSLLGHFFLIEIDPLFITALLTVIGFSVHDTIVIFDRIRENLIKGTGETFEEVVNRSVVEMLPRTINTSFLVWAILLVLFIFGGPTIKYFVLALLIGIFSGSYSSILNASPLLISWENYKKKRKAKVS
jgi:preprotein translocase subunit SecF